MRVSRQMLQEEAHALVNSWVFDHLIIIHHEHNGGGRGFTRVGFWLKQPGKGDEKERSGEYPCQEA